jgi:electron transfer flavoprotein alpha subunit
MVDRVGVYGLLAEFDEYAVEQGLQSTGRPELTETAIVVSGGRGSGVTSRRSRGSRTRSVAPWARRARRSTRAGCRTPTMSARPARRCPAPQLYVANGISRCDPAPRRHADVQDHRGGQQGRQAPIVELVELVELVDFGVVGDLHTVLPSATEQMMGRK